MLTKEISDGENLCPEANSPNHFGNYGHQLHPYLFLIPQGEMCILGVLLGWVEVHTGHQPTDNRLFRDTLTGISADSAKGKVSSKF